MGKLNYGSTGVSYECKKVDMASGGAPRCPRCQDRVYFNEERKALGKSWHVRCFTCAKCKKSLSSTNCANHEDEIFCTTCHRKTFGPKGYGFAGGAAGLSTEAPKPTRYQSQPLQQPHPQPQEPHQPPQPQSVDNGEEDPLSSLAARAVPAGPVGATHTEAPRTNGPATGTSTWYPSAASHKFANLGKQDLCPRCNKRVYFAEEVNMGLKKWHKLCFKCESCNNLLEPSRCNEHEGFTYCKSCYAKKFGPKGYGFAGGSATVMSSDTAKPFANRTNVPQTHETSSPVKTQPINGSQEWTEPVRI